MATSVSDTLCTFGKTCGQPPFRPLCSVQWALRAAPMSPGAALALFIVPTAPVDLLVFTSPPCLVNTHSLSSSQPCIHKGKCRAEAQSHTVPKCISYNMTLHTDSRGDSQEPRGFLIRHISIAGCWHMQCVQVGVHIQVCTCEDCFGTLLTLKTVHNRCLLL